MSSNKNFTQNFDKIVSFDPEGSFNGTISETQYASGIGSTEILINVNAVY